MDQAATDQTYCAAPDERYFIRWVYSLQEHPSIPSPGDVLGYSIGARGWLTQVEEIYGYFEASVVASNRVETFLRGKIFERCDRLLVATGDPANTTKFETCKAQFDALADKTISNVLFYQA